MASEQNADGKPVIGILCQDLSVSIQNKFGTRNYSSCLASSYVNFIEDAGGRCLPIALRQNSEYYKKIVKHVDGILLPGGGFSLADSRGYTPSAKLLLDAVIAFAENNDGIPVFGICLGFEMIAVYFASDNKDKLSFDILGDCWNTGWHKLYFREEVDYSRLLRLEQIEKLENNSLSYFFHRKCLRKDGFKRLKNYWRAIGEAEVPEKEESEENGIINSVEVITWIESKKAPYFGVQFHPEKAKFESKQRKICDDIETAEMTSATFSETFILEAKKSRHTFPKEAEKVLINNFIATDVTEEKDIKYDFVYLFKHDNDLVCEELLK